MKERICQAEYHSENCPCVTCSRQSCGNCKLTNVDHFTPKCVAKKLKWNGKVTNSPENLQYLSLECHRVKDRSTPARVQKCKNGFKNLNELRDWRNKHDLWLK